MGSPAYGLPSSGGEQKAGPEVVSPRPNRRRFSNPLSGGFLVLIVAAVCYFARQNAPPKRDTAGRGGSTVPAIAVSLGDIHSTVRISGTVIAERSAMIRAPRIMGSRADAHRGGGGPHGGGPGGHPDFTLTREPVLQFAYPLTFSRLQK